VSDCWWTNGKWEEGLKLMNQVREVVDEGDVGAFTLKRFE
jgi:hypothetical protein